MQCIIMENILIKLTLHDETKKRAQINTPWWKKEKGSKSSRLS